MAVTFSLNQESGKWRVKIIGDGGEPFDVNDIDTVSIVFYKPDGTRFVKPGELVEDLPDNPGEFFIQYINDPPEESILDLIGKWEYSGAGTLVVTEAFFETSQRAVFWVL